MPQASSWKVHRKTVLTPLVARLFDALEAGDEAAVQDVLAQPSDPDALLEIEIEASDDQGTTLERWSERHTPLSWALACSASPAVLTALLDAGARSEVPDVPSPLLGVMAAGHWGLAQRLIEQADSVGVSEDVRLQAFMLAWRHQHAPSLAHFGKHGWTLFMDLPPADAQRLRALPKEHRLMDTVHALARHEHLPDDWEQRLGLALEHDRASLNVARQAFAFRTPLATAVVAGHEALVKRLLQEGAEVNQTIDLQQMDVQEFQPEHHFIGPDEHGNVVFFQAMEPTHEESPKIQELFVHWRDKAISPLYLAASLENVPVCHRLLEHGADLNQRSTNGRPWRLADLLNARDASMNVGRFQMDHLDENVKTRLANYRHAKGLSILDMLTIQGSPDLYSLLEGHVLRRASAPIVTEPSPSTPKSRL